MNKKLFLVVMIGIVFSLLSCGNKEALVERSIDGVAEYLGYFDGEAIDLNEDGELHDALVGKYFKDGMVSIYEFDPNSPSYEFWASETDTCVDGFVLLYDNSDELTAATYSEMDEEVDKIKKIKFKAEED